MVPNFVGAAVPPQLGKHVENRTGYIIAHVVCIMLADALVMCNEAERSFAFPAAMVIGALNGAGYAGAGVFTNAIYADCIGAMRAAVGGWAVAGVCAYHCQRMRYGNVWQSSMSSTQAGGEKRSMTQLGVCSAGLLACSLLESRTRPLPQLVRVSQANFG